MTSGSSCNPYQVGVVVNPIVEALPPLDDDDDGIEIWMIIVAIVLAILVLVAISICLYYVSIHVSICVLTVTEIQSSECYSFLCLVWILSKKEAN